ncbi:hypothetical protein F53441_13406 [Fusarium austroafricanum]|uniref:Uncharacterized protein n=1 Tax=Fusarium austroafricanum TaxID=2364996 RepID=A0A8H4JRT0_9HYPO|nr:hypothetical protein F53441_13406 [Fusarium austroafricanum]
MFQPFKPKPGQENNFSFGLTPSYLFRLYTPNSAGYTDVNHVASPACCIEDPSQKDTEGYDCNMDLLQLPPVQAAKRLSAHLEWKCQNGRPCNLMSWSSSLLFLLQYGLYRHTIDFERPALSDIHLIMIDTRDFPRQTFLRDLDAMNHFKGYCSELDARREGRLGCWYFGEYLTQGNLHILGKSSRVSMQQLIDLGLFTVCPDLNKPEKKWDRWAFSVLDIRRKLRQPHVLYQQKMRTAMAMAQVSIEDRFIIPLSLMLIALQGPQPDKDIVVNAFRAMFTELELSLGDVKYDLRSDQMVDLELFKEMMESVRTHPPDDSLTQISESFQRLLDN